MFQGHQTFFEVVNYSAPGLRWGSNLQDARLVSNLAKEANLEEAEARSVLYENGILRKKRLLRIPRRLIPNAKRSLEIGRQKTLPAPTAVTASEPPVSRKKRRSKRKQITWPTIGRAEKLEYLTPSDVKTIHYILVDDFKTSKDPIIQLASGTKACWNPRYSAPTLLTTVKSSIRQYLCQVLLYCIR